MGIAIRVSTGFRNAGWTLATGGFGVHGMGSSLAAYLLRDAPAATWRIRVGARVTHLERRTHGTPTKRASAGHWELVAKDATPTDARSWTRLGRSWARRAGEHLTEAPPVIVRGSNDPNRCATRASGDGGEAQTTGARGRCGKSNPSRLEAFGYAPAAGIRLLPKTREGELARKRERNRRKRTGAAKARRAAARARRFAGLTDESVTLNGAEWLEANGS